MLRLVILRLSESYFRHRWLYLLPLVLMIVAALLYYFLATPVYVTQGIFFVQEESILTSITSLRDSGYSWDTPAQKTVSELNELIQTDAFMRAVIEKTDLEEDMNQSDKDVEDFFDDVRELIGLTEIGDNQVRIRAENENPLIAQQLVQATFETFLQWKINADRNEGQVATSFFVSLVNDYKSELDAARQVLNDYLIAHPEPLRGDRPTVEQIEIERLQSEINLAEDRYSNALNKDEDAQLALAQAENAVRQTYFLIDAPTIPTEPGTSLKDTVISMAIFVAVGVVLSVMGIVGGALLDRTFRFPIDVHYGLNLPVLTEIEDLTPAKKRWQRKRNKAGKEREVEQVGQTELAGAPAEPAVSAVEFTNSGNDSQQADVTEAEAELVK